MKKVLVLNGDSYVGRHVVKAFYQSHEYDVEVTRTKSDSHVSAPLQSLASPGASANSLSMRKNLNSSGSRLFSYAAATPSQMQQKQEAEVRVPLPEDIRLCVCGVVPKHNDDTEAFRTRLLANDIVVAVLEDDTYEANCAIRILESTHYEVEKTFVLVSSALTWAYTLESERARARITQQRERAVARDSFFEELLDAEDEGREDIDDERPDVVAAREARRAARRRELEDRLPPSLREPLPGEDEEEICELVPDRVFTEQDYATRVPHPRFQHWHSLEHLVKRANSQTLHTYVVFAGLPYGDGEGEAMLYGLLRSAWYHQTLLQYGPGTNAIPMIHVQDLAAILFKLGNSYDTLDERYMFAVDQGKVTQRQLLQAVQSKLGGSVQPAACSQHALHDVETPITATTTLAAVAGVPSAGSEREMTNGSARVSALATPARAAAPLLASAYNANLVKLDRLELPPPSSPKDLFRVFGNEPCWGDGGTLLSTFVLSDIQAEPAAVLNLHPPEEWVALEGFTMSLDLVVAQFRDAREQMFHPVRVLITGPPLSGAESLGVLVAQKCHTPFLNASTIVQDYRMHVADVREALRTLLVRRLLRRRARVQALQVRRAAQVKEEQRAAQVAKRKAKHDAKLARQQRKKKRSQDNEGEESSDDETDDDDAEDEGNPAGAEEESDAEGENLSNEDSLNSSISIFITPKAPLAAADEGEGEEEDDVTAGKEEHQRVPLRPVEEVVNEAYLRGGANAAGDDDDTGAGEGAMIDEEQEEDDEDGRGELGAGTWLEQLEEQDAEMQAELLEGQELLPEEAGSSSAEGGQRAFVMPRFAARRRGRAFARDVDRQELRCIAALRCEYLLGLKVLSLKVSSSDGRLPRPPPPPRSDEDEEDNYERTNKMTNKLVKERSQRQEDRDEEGEEELEGSSRQDSDDAAEFKDDADAATEGAASETEAHDEEDNDNDDDASSAGVDGSNVLEAAGEEDAMNFLDPALAFMCRWRMRQSDCRCQGYVLGNFPQTLSQAVLCFKANEAELEDAELRRQRALAPLLTRLDDHENSTNRSDAEAGRGEEDDGETPLPPPLDEDFPLPDIANMEEAQLRVLEKAHWNARGNGGAAHLASLRAAENEDDDADESTMADPEEMMAPVDEALFVDHVVILEANTTLLRATVEALETNLVVAGTSPSKSSEPHHQQHQPMAESSEVDALDDLRSFLSSIPYASQLEDYLRNHSPTAPPTQSLLAWLRAVTTTPALGVRPAPVIVPLDGDGAGADGLANVDTAGGEAADASEAGVATTMLKAPPTTRTAEVVTVPAPVLTVAQVKASWCIAHEASHPRGGNNRAAPSERDGEGTVLLKEKLPMALLRLSPLFWTGATTTDSFSSRLPHRPEKLPRSRAADKKKVPPQTLTDLEAALSERLVPQQRLAACTAAAVGAEKRARLMSLFTPPTSVSATTSVQPSLVPEEMSSISVITRERLQLADLEKREVELVDRITRDDAAQMLQERVALRKLQLTEDSREASALLQMPMESYLMKYVLPSLTPAITEVVRTRADDPVTALANVLFDYHRRTTI